MPLCHFQYCREIRDFVRGNHSKNSGYHKTDVIQEKIEDKITQNWVQIAIQDSGTGIKAEDMPYLFEPFYTKSSERTGLGLSIVLGLVELHNGKIKIDSQEGKGTTVKIHLPVE